MNKSRIIIILFFLIWIIGLGSQIQAADCGGNPCNCQCGDTLTTDGTLTEDLNCTTTLFALNVQANLTLNANITTTGDGLVVGADGITIDGGNHTITGDGGASDYGINDSGGYDTVIIQNFSNITNFDRGINFYNSRDSTIQNNITNSNAYGIYLDRPSTTGKYWWTVASDSDGSNLIAAVSNGRLYTSSDFGLIWTERQPAGAANKYWVSVASDSDGSNLIAAVSDGRLYTSSDSGASWTERQPAGAADKSWWTVASDSDGSNLIVAVYDGRLYTSIDSGASWTERQPAGAADKSWISVASDSDGSNLIAAVFDGRLYTSSDSGASWTERQPAGAADKSWWTVASDSDGSNLIATDAGYIDGRLYTGVSIDSGVTYTWTEQYPPGGTPANKSWVSVASDSDGSNLIVAVYDGLLYTSSDSGATWAESPPTDDANNTLANNTANLNTNSGIYLNYSNSNTLTNNTTDSNTNSGIYLYCSDSNTLTNNVTNLNSGSSFTYGGNQVHSVGIFLTNSSSNYLGLDNAPGTGNTANSNSNTGIYISGGSGNHLNYNTMNLNNRWGILIIQSNNNIAIGNTANSNGVYGIQFDVSDYNTLTGNTANSNTTYDGIYLYDSSHNTLENNTVQNNSYTGIRIREGSHSNTVTGNIVESNQYGIYLANNYSNTLTNNIINSNTSDGIHLDASSSNTITGNTFYNTLLQFALTQINNSTGTLFKDNIVYSGKYVSVASGSQTGSEYNYNDYYGGSGNYFNWIGTDYSTFADWQTNSGQDANSLNLNPKFTNVAGDDFSLFSLQSSSPCIDAGIDVNVNTDHAGKERYDHPDVINTGSAGSYAKTYVDMGAYEAYEYVTPLDPVLTSTSHPSQSTWYNDNTPDMSVSNASSTTHYHYLVNQTEFPDKADVEAGTEDSDGIFTVPDGIINSDGTWYVHIIAQNLDNDSSTNFDTYTIKYDGTPPAVFALSLPVNNAWQNDSRPAFYWNSSSDLTSGLVKYQLYIDGNLDTDDINIASTSITPTNSLNDGSHTWYVKTIDNASNERQSTSTYTVKIDTGTPPAHLADTDGDGMPDEWETANDLDPNSAIEDDGADGDPDGDGWTNLEEYQLGSDPNNASPTQPTGSPLGDRVSFTPTLEASDYTDTETDPHLFTEWQISYGIDFADTELVFDNTTSTNKQTIQIPLAILKPETVYYWRVRYSDLGGWSQWSVPVQFTTESLDEFLNETEGIDTTDVVESDTGTVIQAFKQSPDNLPGASGYLFFNNIFSFRIEGITPGATVSVTFQLDEVFRLYHKWLKYYPSVGTWDDTYAAHILNGIGNKYVTLEFKDGGFGDIDGLANGVIVDPSGPAVSSGSGDEGGDGSHCFIATAAYGTPMAEEVRVLRGFRDNYLLTNPIGKIFVKTYYNMSPPVAGFIKVHPMLKSVMRGMLKPIIWLSEKRIN